MCLLLVIFLCLTSFFLPNWPNLTGMLVSSCSLFFKDLHVVECSPFCQGTLFQILWSETPIHPSNMISNVMSFQGLSLTPTGSCTRFSEVLRIVLSYISSSEKEVLFPFFVSWLESLRTKIKDEHCAPSWHLTWVLAHSENSLFGWPSEGGKEWTNKWTNRGREEGKKGGRMEEKWELLSHSEALFVCRNQSIPWSAEPPSPSPCNNPILVRYCDPFRCIALDSGLQSLWGQS